MPTIRHQWKGSRLIQSHISRTRRLCKIETVWNIPQNYQCCKFLVYNEALGSSIYHSDRIVASILLITIVSYIRINSHSIFASILTHNCIGVLYSQEWENNSRCILDPEAKAVHGISTNPNFQYQRFTTAGWMEGSIPETWKHCGWDILL